MVRFVTYSVRLRNCYQHEGKAITVKIYDILIELPQVHKGRPRNADGGELLGCACFTCTPCRLERRVNPFKHHGIHLSLKSLLIHISFDYSCRPVPLGSAAHATPTIAAHSRANRCSYLQKRNDNFIEADRLELFQGKMYNVSRLTIK
jgi:hypothetical protein